MTILQTCFNYVVADYRSAPSKIDWLRIATVDRSTDSEPEYYIRDEYIKNLIFHAFGQEHRINMFQKKGHNQLTVLLRAEITHHLENILTTFETFVFKEHNVTSYEALFHPPAVGTPTEIEAIQCFICATNKKDRALPCGHSYCCCCVETMPNGKCPECNTVFDKKRVIKLYL